MADKQTQTKRKLAKIAQISQIGTEMAVPVGVGIGVDFWLGTMPWFTLTGAVLGPIAAFIHLLSILRSPDSEDASSK